MDDWDLSGAAKKPAITIGEALATLSIGELEERIAALGAEIARIEAEIAAKKARRDEAAAIFKD